MKQLLFIAALPAALAVSACAPRAATPAATAAGPADAAGAHQHGDEAGHQHDPSMQHLPATAGPGYTVADVKFMQHMIGHHEQALVMAAMAPTHGSSDHFQRLAQKIDISQRDEIAMMKRWLTERNQPVPPEGYMDHMMPGMLTKAELARLDAARGREFERLFLTFMIRHHEGALTMVEELFDTPGAGQEPDIFRFATDVDADQRDEIYTMRTMLDTLENTSRSPAR